MTTLPFVGMIGRTVGGVEVEISARGDESKVCHGEGGGRNSGMKRVYQGLWAAPILAGAALAFVLVPVLPASAAPGTAVSAHNPAGCTTSHVLLLGSYPSEVSANLQREVLDPDQPTVIDGLDFYAGTLDGNRVVIAIAGPAPAVTYATTMLALQHFACTSAVVFSGTAGGGGESQLGDVTVPSAWTDNNGASFSPVSPVTLAVAREIQANASTQLSTSAPVDDGPCQCQGQAEALKVVPILRSPRVIVGGYGTTYGEDDLTCTAQGGMLEGCNPCPPSSGSSDVDVNIPITEGASATEAAREASLEMRAGMLVPDAQSLLARHAAPPPVAQATTDTGTTTAGTEYIADDEQTTGAQQAANANKVPFIAFRGISDTSAVGNLWPFEWLVYQQLAADNSSTAARLWIQRWDQH